MNKISIIVCTVIFAIFLFAMSAFIYNSSLPTTTVEDVEIIVEEAVTVPELKWDCCLKLEEVNTEVLFDYACNFCEEIHLEEEQSEPVKEVIKDKKSSEKKSVTYGDKIKVTEYERTLLMRLLYCESCTGTIEEQRAIISVVFNRLNAKNVYTGKPAYGTSIYDVVYYQYPSGAWAFSPAGNDRLKNSYDKSKKYHEQLYEQVDYVLNNGITVPENVRYFCSNSYYAKSDHFRNNYTVYAVYGDTTFMYE